MKFQIGVSRMATGKDGYQQNKWDFGNSFHTEEHTAETLAALLASAGYPVTMVHHRIHRTRPDGRRTTYRVTENFISTQVLFLDDDRAQPGVIDEWLRDPFFTAYGAFIYESASSTPAAQKARPVFILDRALTDPAQVKESLKAFRFRYPHVDNIHDAARVWYGAAGSRVHRLGNVLPLAILDAEILTPYRAHLAQQKADREQQARLMAINAPTRPVSGDTGPYLDRAIAGILNFVASRAEGERHSAVLWAGRKIGEYERASWAPPVGNVEAELMQACDRNGYTSVYGESEILRNFNDGRRLATEPAPPPVERSCRHALPPEPAPAPPPPVPAAGVTFESSFTAALERLQQTVLADKLSTARWDFHLFSDLDPDMLEYKRDQYTDARKWREWVEREIPDQPEIAEAEYRRKLLENRKNRERICGTPITKTDVYGEKKNGHARCGYCFKCKQDQARLVKQKIESILIGYDLREPGRIRAPQDIAYFHLTGKRSRSSWVRKFGKAGLAYQVLPVGAGEFDMLVECTPELDEVLLPLTWQFLDPIDLTEERLAAWVLGEPGEKGSGRLLGSIRNLYKEFEPLDPWEIDRDVHRRAFDKLARRLGLDKKERPAAWQAYLQEHGLIEFETRGIISPQAGEFDPAPLDREVHTADELQEAVHELHERGKRAIKNGGGVILGVVRYKHLYTQNDVPKLIESFNQAQQPRPGLVLFE